MKVINIIWVCVVICSGWITPCLAQQPNEKDKVIFGRVASVYEAIPLDLNVDELLQKVNEADRQVNLAIDSLSTREAKEKARLLRFSGLLRSLGRYVTETGDQMLKSELAERINGLDLDSPNLDLLSDVEIMNLLNGYFRVFMSEVSELERGTYVLYNIKSEKVRNLYVLPMLIWELKQKGYTTDIQNLLDDIELCSKTEATIQKAKELKAEYYPVRVGEMAPDFEMENEYGNMVKLSDFRGKVVFIDVWATWCGGCVEGLPDFMALRDQYKDRKDVVFLTISDDGIEGKAHWQNFLKEKKYTGKIPHLLINNNKDRFEEDYCITGIPRYILIDKEGKIVNAWHLSVKHELFPFFFSTELENMNRERI